MKKLTITGEDIAKDILATDYEKNFVQRLSRKQKEMYLARKYVHLYMSLIGGTQTNCLVELNKFLLINGYKERKSVKSISNIVLEERNFKEFEDYYS